MDFRNRYITAKINITGKNPRVFDINTDIDKPQLFIDVKMEMLGFDAGRANVRIFGLSPDTMKACAILNPQSAIFFGNTITISVNKSVLFTGEIFRSVPNYSEAPNLSLDIECFTSNNGLRNSIAPVEQIMYPSPSVDFKTKTIHEALSFIAMEICGYNQGRDVFKDERAAGRNYSMDEASCLYLRTSEPLPYRLYLCGTPKEILDGFCRNFGIQYALRNNKARGGQDLYYWPMGKLIPSNGGGSRIWPISVETGNLIGYPDAMITGCKLKCEFNPNMQVGDGISLKTIVPGLSKTYVISKLEGYISTREGKWEADLEGVVYGQ